MNVYIRNNPNGIYAQDCKSMDQSNIFFYLEQEYTDRLRFEFIQTIEMWDNMHIRDLIIYRDGEYWYMSYTVVAKITLYSCK